MAFPGKKFSAMMGFIRTGDKTSAGDFIKKNMEFVKQYVNHFIFNAVQHMRFIEKSSERYQNILHIVDLLVEWGEVDSLKGIWYNIPKDMKPCLEQIVARNKVRSVMNSAIEDCDKDTVKRLLQEKRDMLKYRANQMICLAVLGSNVNSQELSKYQNCLDIIDMLATSFNKSAEQVLNVVKLCDVSKDVVVDILSRVIQQEEIETKRNQYLLHKLASDGEWDLVRMLLSKGYDVTKVDQIGDTPLHLAVKNGSSIPRDIFEFLAHPCIINQENDDGKTPLDEAISKKNEQPNHKNVVKLIKANATLNAFCQEHHDHLGDKQSLLRLSFDKICERMSKKDGKPSPKQRPKVRHSSPKPNPEIMKQVNSFLKPVTLFPKENNLSKDTNSPSPPRGRERDRKLSSSVGTSMETAAGEPKPRPRSSFPLRPSLTPHTKSRVKQDSRSSQSILGSTKAGIGSHKLASGTSNSDTKNSKPVADPTKPVPRTSKPATGSSETAKGFYKPAAASSKPSEIMSKQSSGVSIPAARINKARRNATIPRKINVSSKIIMEALKPMARFIGPTEIAPKLIKESSKPIKISSKPIKQSYGNIARKPKMVKGSTNPRAILPRPIQKSPSMSKKSSKLDNELLEAIAKIPILVEVSPKPFQRSLSPTEGSPNAILRRPIQRSSKHFKGPSAPIKELQDLMEGLSKQITESPKISVGSPKRSAGSQKPNAELPKIGTSSIKQSAVSPKLSIPSPKPSTGLPNHSAQSLIKQSVVSPIPSVGLPKPSAGSPILNPGSPMLNAGSPRQAVPSPKPSARSPESSARSPSLCTGSPKPRAGSPILNAG